MVSLDLQKAFDTVDHSILLTKLEALGISEDVVRWFRSYLSDRQQLGMYLERFESYRALDPIYTGLVTTVQVLYLMEICCLGWVFIILYDEV